MNVKHLTPELLRGMRTASIPSAEQQEHLEVRLITMYLTLAVIMTWWGRSPTYTSSCPCCSTRWPACRMARGRWARCSAWRSSWRCRTRWLSGSCRARWPRAGRARLRQLAAVIVTVSWCYLAILSLPMDAGPLFWLYMRHAVESVGLAFLYAISLNAQLLRAFHKVMHP